MLLAPTPSSACLSIIYEPYVISVTASGNAVVIKSVADSGSAVSLKKD